jgi:hypothetical protein
MCLDRVTDDSADLYPWRQLKNLGEKLSVELEVVQTAFAGEEFEGEITGLQVLGEPGMVCE